MACYDFAKDKFEEMIREDVRRKIEKKVINGPIFDTFGENPEQWTEIVSRLDVLLEQKEFQEDYIERKSASINQLYEIRKKSYDESIANGNPNPVYKAEMERYEKEFCYTFEEWKNCYINLLKALAEASAGVVAKASTDGEKNFYARLNYEMFMIEDLYDFYKSDRGLFVLIENTLFEDFYEKKDHNWLEQCKTNYGLVCCGDRIEVQIDGIPKIYDKVHQSYILISKLLPCDFVKKIVDLQKEKKFKLSLRPDYDVCGENLTAYSPSLNEEVIFGKPIEGKLSSILDANKFVDFTTNDQFLVYCIDKNSVMFEEVVEGFLTCGKNCIVTRAVHIQFKDEKEGQFINHMDQEYLFYTQDEFENKKNNVKQYGSAKERYKTFKIDDAKIAYEKNTSDNLLYQTLHAFFKNHNLIDEYFQCLLEKEQNVVVDDKLENI